MLNEAQIKSMTGNDTLNARFLHENSFDFKPQFKLYVNTNYLPAITDMTLFSSGRIVIIPFDRHFEEWSECNYRISENADISMVCWQSARGIYSKKFKNDENNAAQQDNGRRFHI